MGLQGHFIEIQRFSGGVPLLINRGSEYLKSVLGSLKGVFNRVPGLSRDFRTVPDGFKGFQNTPGDVPGSFRSVIWAPRGVLWRSMDIIGVSRSFESALRDPKGLHARG